ncbi:class I adenylate-forming enzyme family protein [Wenjunlia tyrosinilytica]|uniref:Ligase n=1 Tax=Wenjunlia tyrosinilytica TaxID=1544741 RepID=A0A917ZWP9_9ACTN|nr:AMP-binding protein [Wenjunlia tyrosinilytica]GGO97197.1 ligase [Wenjunlia tyrosinilytica]
MNTVASLIESASRRYAARTAVVDGRRSLSFAQTDRRSNRLAHVLLALTPDPGSRVALLMNNRLEYVECDFAVAKAGKVRVSVNPRLVDQERQYILDDCGADTLICDSDHVGFAVRARDALPTLKHLIVIDGAPAGAHDYADIMRGAADSAPRVPRRPEAPSYIMYTSGTSGRPKGATASVAGRVASTVNMLLDEIDPKAGDAMLHVGSMCHGSGAKVLAYYLRGARNVTLPKFAPSTFFDTVVEHGITGTFVVPTMIGMLLETARSKRVDVGRLRDVTYGGAPITPSRLSEALERFGPIFVQVYGSCEAPHPVMVLGRDDHTAALSSGGDLLTSVGRESTLVETRLMTESGAEATDGRGELWVRGPNVMSGYWNNPQATAEVFHDGWYRTGDVAVRDDNGFHYIVDRVRDVIISGGLNVYPAEVEAAISKHPAVHDVAVIGVPDERWGEAVKAVVVVKPGAHIDEDDLVGFCADHLAGYKKPRSFDFVASLPTGSTGKVLKRELAARYWDGRQRRVN